MKDYLTCKFLHYVCIIGLVILASLIIMLPKIVPIVINGVNGDIAYATPLMILLYINGMLGWVLLWNTKELAKNVIILKAFSQNSLSRVRIISLCSLSICICFTLSLIIVDYSALNLAIPAYLMICSGFMVSLVASVIYKLLKVAINLQEENDLTI
ncbi:hypothetical protein AN641_05950 [Candidatus Epulonipiscioides gigas]|nr:hypothetical protein AN641_05950 [Epulopiscium sp. SCG-C07WGA-EpuloA2]